MLRFLRSERIYKVYVYRNDDGNLLAQGADVRARTSHGKSPLHWAAGFNAPAVVEALLAAGADVDARTETGETPLHVAANYGSASAARALFDAGSDADARTVRAVTPLHVAASFHMVPPH